MKDESKGTYILKSKNDNFPDGKIEYDFNNINGFSTMKVSRFLAQQQYVSPSPTNDLTYNACLFALASKQDMGAILSLNYVDFNAVATMTMFFFATGLDADQESSIQAEDTEK